MAPQPTIDLIIEFHGPRVRRLGLGIRTAEVAVGAARSAFARRGGLAVETDMCGVDAIQFLTGCTFGQGNLAHRDFGKNAHTFIRRSEGWPSDSASRHARRLIRAGTGCSPK